MRVYKVQIHGNLSCRVLDGIEPTDSTYYQPPPQKLLLGTTTKSYWCRQLFWCAAAFVCVCLCVCVYARVCAYAHACVCVCVIYTTPSTLTHNTHTIVRTLLHIHNTTTRAHHPHAHVTHTDVTHNTPCPDDDDDDDCFYYFQK